MLGRKKPDETNQSTPTPPQQARNATAAGAPWSPPAGRADGAARGEAPTRGEATRGEATRGHMHIGKSVHMKGELVANEEMTIDGAVDGSIVIDNHQLTIGTHGRITATIRAKSIVVMGKVVGNITAEDKVEVRNGGSVEGDIRGPRVILADGALFKGNVDMAMPPASGPRTGKGEKTASAAGPAEADSGSDSGSGTSAVDAVPSLFDQDLDEVVAAEAGEGTRRSGRFTERT